MSEYATDTGAGGGRSRFVDVLSVSGLSNERSSTDDAASGGIVPNATGIATGFPQIQSEAIAVKAAFRDRIRAQRRVRTAAERAEAAAALVSIVLELPEIQSAHCVALYAATRTEPQTAPLRETLRHLGVSVLLPLVRPGGLEWGLDTGDQLIARGGLGGPEPAGPSLGPHGVLAADVVLVPALAVDTLGTRLGQGGGYYDAALSTLDRGVSVFAVVHDEEVLDASVEPLPSQDHDVPVDGALTPLRCLRLPGRA
jgi:5-formyltetrahydrofolate cyclo-ligase